MEFLEALQIFDRRDHQLLTDAFDGGFVVWRFCDRSVVSYDSICDYQEAALWGSGKRMGVVGLHSHVFGRPDSILPWYYGTVSGENVS